MHKQSKTQTGGMYKPAEYYSGNSGRYTATPAAGPAPGAYGAQSAVSHGVIRGDISGPNLAYSGGNMLTGGGKHTRSKLTGSIGKRSNNTKRKSNKKTRKQRAGCWCSGKIG